MTTPAPYASNWDNYWQHASTELDQVFWDSPPERAVASELQRFGDHLPRDLPVVDIGCGHGTQTRELRRHFARVIGVDVSAVSLDLARAADPATDITYEQLDLLDPGAAFALHQRTGDVNLYVRTVLHQLDPEQRPQAVSSLATLLGARGRALVCELAPAADAYFEYLFAEFAGPPPGLGRVLAHGIRPAALGAGDLARAFAAAGLVPLAQGRGAIHTTLTLPGGYPALVPTDLFVFGRN